MLISMLKQRFPNWETLSPEVQDYAVSITVRFLFRGIDSVEYTKTLHKYLEPGSQPTETGPSLSLAFRRELNNNGYCLKNVKSFLWLVYKKVIKENKAVDSKTDAISHIDVWDNPMVKRCLEAFGIEDEDIIPLLTVLYERSDTYDSLRKIFSRYMTRDYKAFTLKYSDSLITSLIETTKPYTYHLIDSKMRFIANHESVTYEELASDLNQHAIFSFWVSYPRFDSYLHATNSIKLAIHNKAINLIKFYTASRRTVSKASLTVSLEGFLADTSEEENASDEITDNYFQTSLENTVAVQNLMLKCTGTRQLFLTLLTGEPHEGFSRFLQEVQGIKRSNDAYYELLEKKRNIEGYIKLAMDYLNIPHPTGFEFLLQLREELS